MRIRLAAAADAAALAALYAPYVTDSIASFEADPPGEAEMAARLAAAGDLYPWLVAQGEAEEILGYASASRFRPRPAYRFTVETSIYLARGAEGRGIGGRLYRDLLETLTAQGFTQAIGAISLPNPASVGLHEKLGFAQAGVYRDVGLKFGQWISVGLWQRPLAPLTSDAAEPRPFAGVWRGA